MHTNNSVEVRLDDVSPSDPNQAINAAARLVSRKLGIIKSLGRGVMHAQDPRCYSLGIAGPDFLPVIGVENSQKAGGGGNTLEQAVAATIGEAVERYCCWFFDRDDMILARYVDLGKDAVHPDDVRLYSEEQCQAQGGTSGPDYFTEESLIYWAQGYSLTAKQPRFVPAGLVYLGYEFDAREAKVGRNASTGLAAGCTLEEAVLAGILECVERDAFAISWLCKLPGKRVEIDDLELNRQIASDFYGNRSSVSIGFFDITQEIAIPSVFSYLLRPSDVGRCLSVSTVTRTRPQAAISKCLREIAQFTPFARYLSGQLADWNPSDDYSDIVTFDHHCMFYVKRPEFIEPALSMYRDVKMSTSLSAMDSSCYTGTILGDIEECLRRLESAGFEVIVIDITTPDVESAGFRVVRVVVPGLVNLYASERWPYLGSRRLQTKYQTAHGRPMPTDGRFGLPHPFP